jgi:oligoribonuclease NrnB/cAMP/cGMP phosphodiesterase (DHH superfamily)
MPKRITIFTDADLDGAGCVLIFKWLFPAYTINYKAVNERSFKESFTNFVKSEDFTKSDVVYICDLNVFEQDPALLDHAKIFYIDHHAEDIKIPTSFLGVKRLIRESSPSCTSLVYKTLKPESLVTLTNYQKLLIALIDDYDSYTLKHPTSLQLNTIFYSLQGDRIQSFWEKFKDGFKGFNDHQNNIIRFHTLKVNQILNDLNVYQAVVPLGSKKYNIISTFAEYALNEVSSHILKKYNRDISIVMNLKTNTVSFRKTKGVDYDVSILAKKLAEGAGNTNAAGGKLTSQMMTFSKIFKPV